MNSHGSTVSNSYSRGTVSGNRYVGGLVGMNSHGSTISDSYSMSTVSGTSDYVGGLVGENFEFSTVSNSYSTGKVTRKSGSGNTYFGGFCGSNNSTIKYCYSTGKVLDESNSTAFRDKGFVGADNNGDYTDNFFDSQVSNQSSSDGATVGQWILI